MTRSKIIEKSEMTAEVPNLVIAYYCLETEQVNACIV